MWRCSRTWSENRASCVMCTLQELEQPTQFATTKRKGCVRATCKYPVSSSTDERTVSAACPATPAGRSSVVKQSWLPCQDSPSPESTGKDTTTHTQERRATKETSPTAQQRTPPTVDITNAAQKTDYVRRHARHRSSGRRTRACVCE